MEKNLKIMHIILCIAAVLLIIYSYHMGMNKIGDINHYVTLQGIVVLLTIITIPIILKIYKKKTTNCDDKTFYKWNLIRMGTMIFVIGFNCLVYSIVHLTSQLLCAIIAAIVLIFFCMPKKEVNEPIKENETNTNDTDTAV